MIVHYADTTVLSLYDLRPYQDSPDRSRDAPETDKDSSAEASAEPAETSKETPAASTVPEQQQPVVKPVAPEQPSERAREPEGGSVAGKEDKGKEASRTPSPAKPQSSKVYLYLSRVYNFENPHAK